MSSRPLDVAEERGDQLLMVFDSEAPVTSGKVHVEMRVEIGAAHLNADKGGPDTFGGFVIVTRITITGFGDSLTEQVHRFRASARVKPL